eukprot:m.191461 g.191461  ORF g.191461 m.191461 type:complete len:718 (+) comp14843_c0_seq1:81-2234(+)
MQSVHQVSLLCGVLVVGLAALSAAFEPRIETNAGNIELTTSDQLLVATSNGTQVNLLDVVSQLNAQLNAASAGLTLMGMVSTLVALKERVDVLEEAQGVSDTVPPLLCASACPGDLVLLTAPGKATAVGNWALPVAYDETDPSPELECTHMPGTEFELGATEITCYAVDESGNERSCAFKVTVLDKEPPTLFCPSDVRVAARRNVVWQAPRVSDNVEVVGMISSHPTLNGTTGSLAVGDEVITYTAIDSSGNTAKCSFSVFVVDVQEPVLSCPANIVVETEAGESFAVVTWSEPAVSEADSDVVVVDSTHTHDANTAFYVGNTTVRYTATDSADNTGTCSFNVTVLDKEAPQFVQCPPVGTLAMPTDACALYSTTFGAMDNVAVTGVTSNLASLPSECSAASLSHIPSGTVTVEENAMVSFSAADAAGNVGTCTFKLVSAAVSVAAIEEVVASLPAYPGDTINIFGTGFGASAEDVLGVRFDGIECESVTWVSSSQIQCVLATVPTLSRYGGGWTHVMTLSSSNVVTNNAVGTPSSSPFKLSNSDINALAGTQGLEFWLDQNGFPFFWSPVDTSGNPRTFTTTSHVGLFRFGMDDEWNGPCGHDSQNTNFYFMFFKTPCSYNTRSCSCISGNYENAVYSDGIRNRDGSSFFRFEGWSSSYRMYARPMTSRTTGVSVIHDGRIEVELTSGTLSTVPGKYLYGCHWPKSHNTYRSRGRC